MEVAGGGKLGFGARQTGTVSADDAPRVAHDDVVMFDAKCLIQTCARHGGCAGAVDHELDVTDFLLLYLKGVEQSGARDDGCAVLVIVHHGDVAFLFETALDFKTLGSLDILEVDAAESRRQGFDNRNKAVDVGLVDLDVETVESGKYFEQQGLALHHWFAGESADVAQTEHGRAVGDDGHEVAAVSVAERIGRVFLNFETGICNAGGVGQ